MIHDRKIAISIDSSLIFAESRIARTMLSVVRGMTVTSGDVGGRRRDFLLIGAVMSIMIAAGAARSTNTSPQLDDGLRSRHGARVPRRRGQRQLVAVAARGGCGGACFV